MKFEVGKYYKTRDDRKARYVGETILCLDSSRLVFEVTYNNPMAAHICMYDKYGQFVSDEKNNLDIISEWEDASTEIKKLHHQEMFTIESVYGKINELVDTVNELREKIKC